MKKWNLIAVACISILASQVCSAATYLGSWDLKGAGKKQTVYKDGASIRVVDVGGDQRIYSIGNLAWSFVDARDTDGKPGLELVVRAGNDLAVISHATQTKRTYTVGNMSWSIVGIIELNNKAGEEIVINTYRGIKFIHDATQNFRDIDFNHTGTWTLFGIANLGSAGPDLVINMGGGVKLMDPRTYQMRDFTFQGYSAIFSTSQLDSKAGLEVVGRTAGTVYVISGGVKSPRLKEYPATTSSSWAIYGRTADTDGKAGDEIILVMQGLIRIISHAQGYSRDYPIAGGNYSIDSVTDMDGRAGNEIILRDAAGTAFMLNDRTGVLSRM